MLRNPPLPGWGGGCQETVVRRVSSIHVRMRNSAENREPLAVLLQYFQIGRQLIVPASSGREKLIGQQAKVVADRQHPPRGSRRGSGPGKGGNHRFQQRQPKDNARPPQETAAGEMTLGEI